MGGRDRQRGCEKGGMEEEETDRQTDRQTDIRVFQKYVVIGDICTSPCHQQTVMRRSKHTNHRHTNAAV